MEIREAQLRVAELLARIDEKMEKPRAHEDTYTSLLHLIEEIGEICRVLLNQRTGRREKGNLGEELADSLVMLLQLANCCGVDLESELEIKIETLKQRFGVGDEKKVFD